MSRTVRALRPYAWLGATGVALLLLVGVADSLARPRPPREKPTQEEILARIFDEPDILINLEAWDVPGTSDLVLLGNRATPALVNCLVNNLDPGAREICAHVLVATRDVRAIEPLIAALDDPSSYVRARVIEALSAIEARTATPRLIQLATSEVQDTWIAAEAARALGRTGDPVAIEPLMGAFHRTWDGALQQALWDLRRHLTPAQIESLFVDPLLAPRDLVQWDVVGTCIEQTGELQLTSAVEPLIALYPDVTFERRNRIIYNLGRIGDPRAVPFLQTLIDPTGEARLLNNVIFALERLGQDVVPVLRMALTDKRAYIRYNAAFVAGDIRENGVMDDLTVALEDINDIVRSEAAVALGRLADPRASAALVKATRDPHPIVRRDAIAALLVLDYAKHREEALLEFESSDLSEVRQKLLAAFSDARDADAVSRVMLALNPDDYGDLYAGLAYLDRFEQLSDPDALAFLVQVSSSGYNHDAIKLLARFADPRVEFMLDFWMAHPQGEPEQILRGLARLGTPKRQALAKPYLEKDGTMAQLYAAFYFAVQGDPAGMKILLGALENAPLEYKRTAAIILTELDFGRVDGATDALVALLGHTDVYVRLYAARALAHWDVAAGHEALARELEKRIPFITDEVLSIAQRLPEAIKQRVLGTWLKTADPMLARELQRLVAPSGT